MDISTSEQEIKARAEGLTVAEFQMLLRKPFFVSFLKERGANAFGFFLSECEASIDSVLRLDLKEIISFLLSTTLSNSVSRNSRSGVICNS